MKTTPQDKPKMTMGKQGIGFIHSKGSLFLRENVGTADTDEGPAYEMSLHVGSREPILQSVKTGKQFTLTWKQLLELAVKAGIDE